ncbi:MAG: 1-phosphofructokinase [Hungatella sp.]|nr:1-phosphofructokinase [Hungatella sp.]
MVYTVTFNPALDYVVRVNHFTAGAVNRTVEEHIFYGGKGINVSVLLANLGYASTALGFVAGFTGDEIERGVKSLGFSSDFIRVKKGMSRINVKLKSDEESEINGMGPEITPEDVEELFKKLDKLTKGDVLVLSGSIPTVMDSRIYEMILAKLEGKGVLTIVDAEKELLLNVLKYHPFLIKPNNVELGDIFGVVLEDNSEVERYARRLKDMGARNVLVSMAGDGSLLVTEDKKTYRMGGAKGVVKNSVGAGDSMVAGFLAGYLENGDYAHALRLGTAAGGATAFSDGIGTREKIMELYSQLGDATPFERWLK